MPFKQFAVDLRPHPTSANPWENLGHTGSSDEAQIMRDGRVVNDSVSNHLDGTEFGCLICCRVPME